MQFAIALAFNDPRQWSRLAGAAEGAGFGYLLPLRHPVVAAKRIATAALYAEERLILGVGAGWMREEFERPVPIWGGGTSEPALRRAAMQLDGWVSEIQTAREVEAMFETPARHRERAGRAHLPFGSGVTAKDVGDLDSDRAPGIARCPVPDHGALGALRRRVRRRRA